MSLSNAETRLATFVVAGTEYELHQDLLVIKNFEKTRMFRFDQVNILNEHYRIFCSDPQNRLTFIKDKYDRYTLIGKIDGQDIKVKNLEKI